MPLINHAFARDTRHFRVIFVVKQGVWVANPLFYKLELRTEKP